MLELDGDIEAAGGGASPPPPLPVWLLELKRCVLNPAAGGLPGYCVRYDSIAESRMAFRGNGSSPTSGQTFPDVGGIGGSHVSSEARHRMHRSRGDTKTQGLIVQVVEHHGVAFGGDDVYAIRATAGSVDTHDAPVEAIIDRFK